MHTQGHSHATHTQPLWHHRCREGAEAVCLPLIRETLRDSVLRKTWIEVHALPLMSYVAWSSLLNLPEPHFHSCHTRRKMRPSWNNVFMSSTGSGW